MAISFNYFHSIVFKISSNRIAVARSTQMRTHINNNQLAYFEDTQFTLCPAEEEKKNNQITDSSIRGFQRFLILKAICEWVVFSFCASVSFRFDSFQSAIIDCSFSNLTSLNMGKCEYPFLRQSVNFLRTRHELVNTYG